MTSASVKVESTTSLSKPRSRAYSTLKWIWFVLCVSAVNQTLSTSRTVRPMRLRTTSPTDRSSYQGATTLLLTRHHSPVSDFRFDTKLAVVLEADLPVWQKANVAAFLVSGIAGTDPATVGERYVDGSGNRYLPMFREPVLVYAADPAGLRRAHERAMAREIERLAIFTRELFSTTRRTGQPLPPSPPHDLVGLALHADRKTVDQVLDKLRPHP